MNYRADLLSRTIDFDDYTINDDVFLMLDCKWGPHTVDRFACSYNAKFSRYNSIFYLPGAQVVDAFNLIKKKLLLIVKMIYVLQNSDFNVTYRVFIPLYSVLRSFVKH